MNKKEEWLIIKKLMLEFSASSNDTYDLDELLIRLFSILLEYPDLPLDQRAAIVLLNPRGRYYQISQFGMAPPWESNFCWEASIFETSSAFPGSLVRSCSSSDACVQDENRQLLLLPLNMEGQLSGYVVLYTLPTYLPSAIDLDFLNVLAGSLSGLVQRTLTHETLQMRNLELEESNKDAMRSLGVASQYRDDDTGWHIMRMTNIAHAIAKALDLPEAQRELLYITMPMHDVGKIGIPDAILLKPGKLTAQEFEVMKTHTDIGVAILSGKDPMIVAARDIAGSHHERWDGTGYPKGLAGKAIPIMARICAVADVFDALTSTRPYKKPWSVENATEWIITKSGVNFDPDVVRAFEIALPEIVRIRKLYRDDIIDPNQVVTLPLMPPRKNAWAVWEESLSVGIDAIDEHHRYLLDLINDLFEVVSNKRGVREVARLIKATDAYAKVHFRTEEKMMLHYDFKGIQRQHQQHQAFEVKIQELYDELHENPLLAQFNILSYLRDWLIHHIRVEDAQLSSLVRD